MNPKVAFSKSPAGLTFAALKPENYTIIRFLLSDDGSFDFTMSRQATDKLHAPAFAGHSPATEADYLAQCKRALIFIEKILNSELLKNV